MTHRTPVVDSREMREIYLDLLSKRPGFVPELGFPPGSPGALLGAALARYVETIVRRLNQAPEKHKLALLDLLGIGLQAAQPARAAVVFRLNDKATGGSAPAGSPIAAPPQPGTATPIQFETERSVGLTPGKIAQVVSLHPGRDEYLDHTSAFAAEQSFRLFDPRLMRPTPHHIYLSHQTLLALSGNVQLGIEFDVTQPSADELVMVWEYWDGKVWRGFETIQRGCERTRGRSQDGTAGLTRSGTVELAADCAQAEQIQVNGRKAFWLRGRLNQPLPADPDQPLPEVESVRISTTVAMPMRGLLSVEAPTLNGNELFAASIPATGKVVNASRQPVQGAVVTMTVLEPGNVTTTIKSSATPKEGFFTMPMTTGTPVGFQVTWAGIVFASPDGPKPVPESAVLRGVELILGVEGLQPEKASADATKLDVTKPFYPMGQQPQPGTAFYFSSPEVLSKPGAKVRLFFSRTRSPQDETLLTGAATAETPLTPIVAWEYWNGRGWATLPIESNRGPGIRPDLNNTEVADFTVPDDLRPVSVNDEEALWIRMRLESGTYGFRKQISFSTGGAEGGTAAQFSYVVTQPPVLGDMRIGYAWQFGPFFPEQVVTYNDFRYTDRTDEAIWPGAEFQPFERLSDRTPAVYIGFDKKPPLDRLGLYLDVEEETEFTGPALVWEYWNGLEWRELPTEDETARIRRPGIISVLAQSDDSPLTRFGPELHWVRARLKEDGPAPSALLKAIFANAVWASERQTLKDIALGVTKAVPGQVLRIAQIPVMQGEHIELRELNGARANVEWRALAAELGGADAAPAIERLLAIEHQTTDVQYGSLRLKRDRQGRVNEAWVTWQWRKHIFRSGPRDRHYTLDRVLGRLQFGDGVHGMLPPLNADVMARRLTSGGGLRGNVAAGKINMLLAALPGIDAVFNPRAAEGGANSQTLPSVLQYGPEPMRHRGRALSAADYEALARAASAAVAFARAIPLRGPDGVMRPGWVSVLIVPHGEQARPFPSFGLREQVRRYIEARADASLANLHRIAVIGPVYEPVDIQAVLAPRRGADPGAVERAVSKRLSEFLHPVRGGPDTSGWELGRDVYLSDIAAAIESVEGVDYVETLGLMRNGIPQGERFVILDDRIAVAGQFTLNLRLAEA